MHGDLCACRLCRSSNLSLSEIIETQDYSLAAAARPALGEAAVAFTVILAMLATAGGIIASVFAVSRMLAMLTEMKLVRWYTPLYSVWCSRPSLT